MHHISKSVRSPHFLAIRLSQRNLPINLSSKRHVCYRKVVHWFIATYHWKRTNLVLKITINARRKRFVTVKNDYNIFRPISRTRLATYAKVDRRKEKMGLLEIEKRGLINDREDQDHSFSNSSDRPSLHRPPGRTSSGSRFWERDGVRIWSNSNYFSKEDLDDNSGGHLDAEPGPRSRRLLNLQKEPSQSKGKEDEIEDDVLSFFS